MVYPTLLAAVGDVAHPSWRASSVGVYRLWRDMGYAAGALLAGVVADAFRLSAATLTIGALTFASGRGRRRADARDAPTRRARGRSEARPELRGKREARANPPGGYYSLERALEVAGRGGGELGVCGTCMDASGITDEDRSEGTRTLEVLTDWPQCADRALVL